MSAAFDRAINGEDEPTNCLDSLCIAHYPLSLISLINLDNQFSFLMTSQITFIQIMSLSRANYDHQPFDHRTF